MGDRLKYVNVNDRNGESFGNLITLKNGQIADKILISQRIWNVAHLAITKFSMKNNNKNNNIPQTPDVCIADFGVNMEDDDLFLESMKHFQSLNLYILESQTEISQIRRQIFFSFILVLLLRKWKYIDT